MSTVFKQKVKIILEKNMLLGAHNREMGNTEIKPKDHGFYYNA